MGPAEVYVCIMSVRVQHGDHDKSQPARDDTHEHTDRPQTSHHATSLTEYMEWEHIIGPRYGGVIQHRSNVCPGIQYGSNVWMWNTVSVQCMHGNTELTPCIQGQKHNIDRNVCHRQEIQ